MEILVPSADVARIVPLGAIQPTPCDCCGNVTRRVWGSVEDADGRTCCVYYVAWTENSPQHDPPFDLILGRWGEGASASERVGVSLLYRASQNSFTVVDASARDFSKGQDLFSRGLGRSEVIGTSLAAAAFAVVDAVWAGDARIEEITQWE